MRKHLIICLLALAIMALVATNALATETYVMKYGDSLDSVAAQYGVTVEELVLQNQLTSTDADVGTRLVIPSRIQPSRSGSIRNTAGYPDLVTTQKHFWELPMSGGVGFLKPST